MASLQGKKLKQVIDPKLAKAFTHPLRGHVWVTLFERGVASPTEIANELELEVPEVSYHFRKLQRTGRIRLVHTRQRRGFDEHFYEPVAPAIDFDDEEWMMLPEELRTCLSGEMVKQVIESLTGAVEAGCFDTRDRHMSQSWMLVDERGWRELMRTVRHALERFQVIQERAAERSNETGEATIPVAIAMAAFETAGSVAARDAGKSEEL